MCDSNKRRLIAFYRRWKKKVRERSNKEMSISDRDLNILSHFNEEEDMDNELNINNEIPETEFMRELKKFRQSRENKEPDEEEIDEITEVDNDVWRRRDDTDDICEMIGDTEDETQQDICNNITEHDWRNANPTTCSLLNAAQILEKVDQSVSISSSNNYDEDDPDIIYSRSDSLNKTDAKYVNEESVNFGINESYMPELRKSLVVFITDKKETFYNWLKEEHNIEPTEVSVPVDGRRDLWPETLIIERDGTTKIYFDALQYGYKLSILPNLRYESIPMYTKSEIDDILWSERKCIHLLSEKTINVIRQLVVKILTSSVQEKQDVKQSKTLAMLFKSGCHSTMSQQRGVYLPYKKIENTKFYKEFIKNGRRFSFENKYLKVEIAMHQLTSWMS